MTGLQRVSRDGAEAGSTTQPSALHMAVAVAFAHVSCMQYTALRAAGPVGHCIMLPRRGLSCEAAQVDLSVVLLQGGRLPA